MSPKGKIATKQAVVLALIAMLSLPSFASEPGGSAENSAEVQAYETLGLRPGANRVQVRSAFRELAKRFHPGGETGGDAEKFQTIKQAYDLLAGRSQADFDHDEINLETQFRKALSNRIRESQESPKGDELYRFLRTFYHSDGTAYTEEDVLKAAFATPPPLVSPDLREIYMSFYTGMIHQIWFLHNPQQTQAFQSAFFGHDLGTGVMNYIQVIFDNAEAFATPASPFRMQVSMGSKEEKQAVEDLLHAFRRICQAGSETCILRLTRKFDQNRSLFQLLHQHSALILAEMIDKDLAHPSDRRRFRSDFRSMVRVRRELKRRFLPRGKDPYICFKLLGD